MHKIGIALLATLTVSGLVNAQTNEIYKYKDKSGNVIYSDKMPPSNKNEVMVLSSKSGVLKNMSDIEEYQAQQQLTEEDKQKLADAKQKESDQLEKDKQLLAIYASPKDVDEVKKYELEQLDRAIQNDINIIASLKDRKEQMDKDMKANPKVQAEYNKEYGRIIDSLEKTNDNLEKNKKMYAEREKKYNDDKARLTAVLDSINSKKQAQQQPQPAKK